MRCGLAPSRWVEDEVAAMVRVVVAVVVVVRNDLLRCDAMRCYGSDPAVELEAGGQCRCRATRDATARMLDWLLDGGT